MWSPALPRPLRPLCVTGATRNGAGSVDQPRQFRSGGGSGRCTTIREHSGLRLTPKVGGRQVTCRQGLGDGGMGPAKLRWEQLEI